MRQRQTASISPIPHSLIAHNRSVEIDKSADVVPRCRIGTSALGEGEVGLAGRPHHRWQRIVSFDATRLVIDSIFLVALPGELLANRPWPGPRGRVFDRDLVGKRARAGPRPPLDEVQVLARA